MLGDRLGWMVQRARDSYLAGNIGAWWRMLDETEKKAHMWCAIRELHGQVHELRARNALWMRDAVRALQANGELADERDAAIARAKAAEAALKGWQDAAVEGIERRNALEARAEAAELDMAAWKRRAEHAEATRNLAELDASERTLRAEKAEDRVHELKLDREALRKRVHELEQREYRAAGKKIEAKLAKAINESFTETRDEWHARRCPARSKEVCGGSFRWLGTVSSYDYGPDREFVNRTCAEVYEDEQAEQRFTTWHAQECIWKRLEPNSKFGCNGHELWNISGAAARMDKRFANRTCYNVYEAEVLNRLVDR